jgi:hypothetical protein
MEDDDGKVAQSWNIHFGDNSPTARIRIDMFLKEAQARNIHRFNVAKVRKHLCHEGEEEEEEAPMSDAPSQVLLPKTVTIVIPLTLTEDKNSPLPLPPRAASRQIKKLIGDMMQPIMERAAARAADAARETWLQKFGGGTVELVPSTPCPGIVDIWTQVQDIPRSGIHWSGCSFESEDAQLKYLRKVFDIIKGSGKAPLHVKVLDTHQKGMRSPPCRPDFTLVKGDCRHKKGDNVPWAEIASAGELKRVSGDAKVARIQFAEWAWQILRLQPARTEVIGFILAGLKVEFVKLHRDGVVERTHPIPYQEKWAKQAPNGFKRLVNFVRLDLQGLGVSATPEDEDSEPENTNNE